MSEAHGKTVVVVGSGGREHALAWKLSQSPEISRLIVAPGNAGMPAGWERWQLGSSKADFVEFAKRARETQVDLVVVGPDNPLADGIVNVMNDAGVLALGPTREAAQLEASKAFAKDVMKAAGIPTAQYRLAQNIEEARKILRSVPWGAGWVIKADGLALGKGVRVCATQSEALSAAEELIQISGSLVIEERLLGEEISWLALCDGDRCALLDPARDYKRIRDRDEGPNTGGMGAFSPIPGVTSALADKVRSQVFEPALREMKKRGASFRGVLYAGLMAQLESERFWVIEFNARFGDPETQVLMPRIEGDIYPWFEACARGDLRALPPSVPFKKEAAVYVVGAAKGYPETPEKGKAISGFSAELEDGVPRMFAAGVAAQEQGLVTSGGRVFGTLGMGANLKVARAQAYERIHKVKFEGLQFRTDVAAKEAQA